MSVARRASIQGAYEGSSALETSENAYGDPERTRHLSRQAIGPLAAQSRLIAGVRSATALRAKAVIQGPFLRPLHVIPPDYRLFSIQGCSMTIRVKPFWLALCRTTGLRNHPLVVRAMALGDASCAQAKPRRVGGGRRARAGAFGIWPRETCVHHAK